MDPPHPPPRAGRLGPHGVLARSSREEGSTWNEDTPADALTRDTVTADATVPVGAMSPFAHWSAEQTSSDGTPVILRPDGPPPAVPAAVADDPAPATLPIGSMSPATPPAVTPPAVTHLAPTRPSPFASMPPMPPSPPAAQATHTLSTALPPRQAVAQALGSPAVWAPPPSAPKSSSALLVVGLLTVGLLVCATLIVTVLASQR